jgi:hypothetical protein
MGVAATALGEEGSISKAFEQLQDPNNAAHTRRIVHKPLTKAAFNHHAL